MRGCAWGMETSKKRVPVIAGTGSNSTDEAIELSRYAEKAGADAVLIVTPFFEEPSIREMLDVRVCVETIRCECQPRCAAPAS